MKSSLILAFLRLTSFLPLGLARALGYVAGAAAVAVATKSYKVAKLNLSLCYPEYSEADIEHLAKQRMAHLGQALFETPVLWRKSADWLQKKILAIAHYISISLIWWINNLKSRLCSSSFYLYNILICGLYIRNFCFLS